MPPPKSDRPSAIDRAIRWVVAHPRSSLALSLGIVLQVAFGATKLQTSKDIRIFFSEDDPQLQAYEAVEQTYTKSTNIFCVVTPRDGGSVFNRDTLAAVQYLTAKAWETPFSRRVDSLTNYQHSWAEGDDIMVEDLVSTPAAELTDDDLERIRNAAMSNPLLVNRLVADDEKVAGANIPIDLPGEDEASEQPTAVKFVRELAKDVEEKFPDAEVRLTGVIMINNALDESIALDGKTIVPAMFGLIFLCLTLLLRSITASLAAFFVIIFSNAFAFGMAGWLGIKISPTVLSAVNMIMTLAVADSVHILAAFRRNFRDGTSKGEAMIDALAKNFRAIFLTSFTTVLGFLSLNTSSSPPFRDLGNIVAIGVAAAWLFVHILLPALVLLLPVRPARESKRSSPFDPILSGLANFVTARPKPILFLGILVTLGMSAFILKNELNDNFVEYFDEGLEFRAATDYMIENLTGFEYIDYPVSAGETGGISDPEYLKKLEAFADWFREQPKVRHVYAYTDMVKRLHKNLHGDEPDQYKLPESRAVAADCLMMYEMSLPYGLDLTDQIDLDKSSTLVKVSVSRITSNELNALDGAAQKWLKENDLSPESAGTSQSMMFAHIGPRNISSLLGGTVAALFLISVCMIFITRSLKYGLASLLPNLAPAAIGFGIWGLLIGQVGLAVSVVVGMTLGIVVDDSIHFITKYLQLRRKDGLARNESIRNTFLSVGDAMITTTLTLALGFGILAFSSFELNSSMGILSATVIGIALAFDLLVLPALLLVLDRED